MLWRCRVLTSKGDGPLFVASGLAHFPPISLSIQKGACSRHDDFSVCTMAQRFRGVIHIPRLSGWEEQGGQTKEGRIVGCKLNKLENPLDRGVRKRYT